jgi:hypothetical protein
MGQMSGTIDDRLKSTFTLRLISTAILLVVWQPNFVWADEPQLETITFQPTNEDFINPERGFFDFHSLTNTAGYNTVRSEGRSIIYGQIIASNFRNGPLSQTFLNQIQAGFNSVRANGLKVKFRVAYNTDGGADAPKSVILNHIQQLKPLWKANKDVIYLMDAGFIGGWGEWHSSTNGLDNNADRTEILNAVLDALPEDRMVGIRTPHYKREIFNGSPTNDNNKITAENAFDGSNLTRVGHLNDCFLANGTDYGTYAYQWAGWTRQDEIDYIGAESKYAPHGGETCADSPFCASANAISEMEQLHTDYMNYDYHPDVIQRWKNEGSYDEINRRLGYRYELQSAGLPDAVKPSSLLQLEFTIDNVGFGELFNPREVEITLRNNTTGEISAAPLQVDPRFWSGGTSNDVQALLSVPADMEEGTYTVGIRMADIEETLKNDVRYSIRFANEGVWEATTGINVLKTDLQISMSAPGTLYQVGSQLGEIIDPSSLLLAGDFDADGDVDGRDLLSWQRGAETLYDAADLAAWQTNYGMSLPAPVASVQAIPEPASLLLASLLAVGIISQRINRVYLAQ